MGEFGFRPPTESWSTSSHERSTKSKLERAGALLGLLGTLAGIPGGLAETRDHQPDTGVKREQPEMNAEELSQALMEQSLEQSPAESLERHRAERELVTLDIPLDDGTTLQETRGTLRVVADAQLTASLNEHLPSYALVLNDLCGYQTTTAEGRATTQLDAEEVMLLYGNQLNFQENGLTRLIDGVVGDEPDLTRRLLFPITNRVPRMGGAGTIGGVEMVGLEKLSGHYTQEDLRTWHQGLYDEARSLVGLVVESGGLTELESSERREAERQVREAVSALTELRVAQAQMSYAIAEGGSANESWAFEGDTTLGMDSGISQLQEGVTRLERQLDDIREILPNGSDGISTDVVTALTDDLGELLRLRSQQESQEFFGMGSGTADVWQERADNIATLLQPEKPEQMAAKN